ncbi:hypothetical protein A3Q56_08023, partial [Intoshia linei]
NIKTDYESLMGKSLKQIDLIDSTDLMEVDILILKETEISMIDRKISNTKLLNNLMFEIDENLIILKTLNDFINNQCVRNNETKILIENINSNLSIDDLNENKSIIKLEKIKNEVNLNTENITKNIQKLHGLKHVSEKEKHQILINLEKVKFENFNALQKNASEAFEKIAQCHNEYNKCKENLKERAQQNFKSFNNVANVEYDNFNDFILTIKNIKDENAILKTNYIDLGEQIKNFEIEQNIFTNNLNKHDDFIEKLEKNYLSNFSKTFDEINNIVSCSIDRNCDTDDIIVLQKKKWDSINLDIYLMNQMLGDYGTNNIFLQISSFKPISEIIMKYNK